MAHCRGISGDFTCGNELFRCDDCGTVGCDQSWGQSCTNKKFESGQCLTCGACKRTSTNQRTANSTEGCVILLAALFLPIIAAASIVWHYA